MALYTDVPTRSEIERLLVSERPSSVSIYAPSSAKTQEAQADRIGFKNLAATAVEQLHESASKEDADSIEEALHDLIDDDDFWAHQANSLAVFASPDDHQVFRLANHLTESVHVASRFYVKPLLRTITFSQSAYVLALAQGSVRLLAVTADRPAAEISVPNMPSDVASAVGESSITDRRPSGRLQGGEGAKVHMRQYARQIDNAIRPVLAGRDIPLILAAAQPLESIYRGVNRYPHLADQAIAGNPEPHSPEELAASARGLLDEIYAAELADQRELFDQRTSEGRTAADLGHVARAATFGAIATVFVDIDADVPGTIDGTSGLIELEEGASEDRHHGVVDEIARRALLAGARIYAVRADDIPGGGPAAAILRYPV